MSPGRNDNEHKKWRRLRPPAAPIKPVEAKSSSVGMWVGTTIAILSVFGTILTLLGYGVAISVEAMGLPHQSLFATPVELLGLSVWAILQLIASIGESFHVVTNFWAIVKKLAPIFGIAFLVCAAGIAVMQFKQFRRMIRGEFPAWVHSSSRRLKLGDGYLADLSRLSAVFLALLISVPVVLVLSSIATIFLVIVLSIFPAMGMSAGEAHIRRYVLEPTKCTPILGREIRLKDREGSKEATATCLQVSNDRRSLGVGRAVFVTSSAVVLFHPTSGAVWRVPTKDAMVEAVGVIPELDPENKVALPVPAIPSNPVASEAKRE